MAKKQALTPRQRAAKKRRNIIIFIVELIVLAIVAVAAWLIFKMTKTEKVNISVGSVEQAENGEKVDVVINTEIYEQLESEESLQKGYTQIALFGVDSRDKNLNSGNNRSDTLIICVINNETKEVSLTSVYRDTYLNVGNNSYQKCNAAYSLGGPTQAINMLNLNLDLAITDYVSIGFTGLIDVIDALGGVYIDVQKNEIRHLNNYQISMVGTTPDGVEFYATDGVDYISVKESGYQKLNGLQATAYCRIRYVGDDYGRTERQRKVITALFEQAKGMDITALTSIANTIFSQISTSLDLNEIISIVTGISSYQITQSEGFPYNLTSGTIGGKGSCVVPLSLSSNVSMLHEKLFGEVDYQPTSTVQEYSSRVYSDTAQYLP